MSNCNCACSSKATSNVNLLNDGTYLLNDYRKCVTLQTKRARYALNMEDLDLLNEESVSSVHSEFYTRVIQRAYQHAPLIRTSWIAKNLVLANLWSTNIFSTKQL